MCLETKPRCILHRSWVGYICTCGRADVPLFSYLENGCMDCAEILFVVRDQLVLVEYRCACAVARAYPFPVSQERLDGLRRDLVCDQRTTSFALYNEWGISARVHVQLSHLSTSIRSRSFTARKASYLFVTCVSSCTTCFFKSPM